MNSNKISQKPRQICRGFFFLAISLMTFSSCRQEKKPVRISWQERFQEVRISAHRGGRFLAERPENCLETMKYVYTKTSAMMECDIQYSRDSILLLMHDKSINRTTNGEGIMRIKSSDELSQYFLVDDYGSQTVFRISKASDLFQWMKNTSVIISFDLKKVEPKSIIDSLLVHELIDQSVIIAYTLASAKKIHQTNSDIIISINIRNDKELDDYLNSGIPKEKVIAFVGTREKTVDFLASVKSNGIKTMLGTLGNLDQKAKGIGKTYYQEMYADGVDVIATDLPFEVHAALSIANSN